MIRTNIDMNFTIGAWNVRTTNDSDDSIRPERATAIITRELSKANIDICALSEVRREGQGNLVERDYTIYWSGGTKKEAGVGFAISNKLSSFVMTTVPISDMLMVSRIQPHFRKYLKLVSVYAPTMQRSQEEKELFYQSLTDILRSERDDLLIILGDFNAGVGSDWELWPNALGKHGIGKMNSNGLMLLNFCTQNERMNLQTVKLSGKNSKLLSYLLLQMYSQSKESKTRLVRFDENNQENLALLKGKNLNRYKLQQRVRRIKNDWLTQKASEAKKYSLENNFKDFYATL